MSAPSVVCLIATWRDGPLLAAAVESAAPHVDAVVVLDGGYAGVVEPIDQRSSPEELNAAADSGAFVIPAPRLWEDEIMKRNVLLELGRVYLGRARLRAAWALVLDADELLVNGERLVPLVASADSLSGDAALDVARFAIPLLRVEPNGTAWRAPSRLFRLTERVRYVERSYWLEDVDDAGVLRVDLSHGEAEPIPDGFPGVYVDHRWDLRPKWRRAVQRDYGRELARRDQHAGA